MKKNVTFLTKRDFDVKLLIKNLKKNSDSITDVKDQQILKEIINLLVKNGTSFLSPQEIHFLDSNDEENWAKYLIFRYKMKYFPRKQLVYNFPIYLLIEPVSACNLRCIMCFQIDESFTSNNNFMGNMEIDLFKKIIDEAVEGGTKAITLASRGEPTLHPKLGEMLEYCSGKFFELKINTNGIILKLTNQGDKMRFALIWHSQYGKEEIDSFDTRVQAIKMREEYRTAFGEGCIIIKRVRR